MPSLKSSNEQQRNPMRREEVWMTLSTLGSPQSVQSPATMRLCQGRLGEALAILIHHLQGRSKVYLGRNTLLSLFTGEEQMTRIQRDSVLRGTTLQRHESGSSDLLCASRDCHRLCRDHSVTRNDDYSAHIQETRLSSELHQQRVTAVFLNLLLRKESVRLRAVQDLTQRLNARLLYRSVENDFPKFLREIKTDTMRTSTDPFPIDDKNLQNPSEPLGNVNLHIYLQLLDHRVSALSRSAVAHFAVVGRKSTQPAQTVPDILSNLEEHHIVVSAARSRKILYPDTEQLSSRLLHAMPGPAHSTANDNSSARDFLLAVARKISSHKARPRLSTRARCSVQDLEDKATTVKLLQRDVTTLLYAAKELLNACNLSADSPPSLVQNSLHPLREMLAEQKQHLTKYVTAFTHRITERQVLWQPVSKQTDRQRACTALGRPQSTTRKTILNDVTAIASNYHQRHTFLNQAILVPLSNDLDKRRDFEPHRLRQKEAENKAKDFLDRKLEKAQTGMVIVGEVIKTAGEMDAIVREPFMKL